MPVELVPPGEYDATLVVTAGDGEPMRLTRPFDLLTAVAPGEGLFADDIRHLPASGNDALLVPAYVTPVLEQALALDGASADPATRDAIAAWTRGAAAAEDTLPKDPESGALLSTTMARGIARLRRGDLEAAAAAFRTAIKLASDFPPAAVYLGACYAAGGRDREAAGAWQLVLALGQEDAVVYRLTADALLRLGDAAAADDVLKDAVHAFPQDAELTRRVALARASAGDAAQRARPHRAAARRRVRRTRRAGACGEAGDRARGRRTPRAITRKISHACSDTASCWRVARSGRRRSSRTGFATWSDGARSSTK